MRTFKIGDKVKFLNEEGGGVISKIISPVLVNVSVDGFDIPTLTKEIVLDYVDDKAGKMFTSVKTLEEASPRASVGYEEGSDFEAEEDTKAERIYLSRKGQDVEKGIYLAFVPQDQQFLIGGDYSIYLVNDSAWEVIYSLFLKDEENDRYIGEDYGSIGEKERLLLSTVPDKDLEKWANGVIQLLFHKDTLKQVPMAAGYRIKVKTSKFFKEGCFEDTGLFPEKALLVPIVLTDNMEIFVDADDENLKSKKNIERLKNLKEDKQTVEIKSVKPTSFFDKHLISRTVAEVDLHIEELIDTTTGMDNADMLKIQMDYFEKCLSKAIEMNLDKIIFIHGVGQGALKHNIEKELDKYSFIHYFPASMQKYGVGATEVIIGKKR